MPNRVRLSEWGSVSPKPGSSPGQIIPPIDAERPVIDAFVYSANVFEEMSDISVEKVHEANGHHDVMWIDVSDIGDAAVVQRIGEIFKLHRLALEDVMNTNHRPKAEEYEDHTFIVTRMPNAESPTGTEQVSFFLGKGFLVTFQSVPGDCFDGVRQRIRAGRGRIRTGGADYLCYALIDTIIDSYFPELERIGDRLERLENEVIANPDRAQINELHAIKRELLVLRRAIWPHREVLSALIRDDHELFSRETQVFLRDCYDHTIQLMDIVETYREIATGLVDLYISSMSSKLNEIMKILTIISTIFIPLGFIAGLYGMNFDRQASPWNMPELGWTLGYPFALFIMAASAGGLLWYFYRKGWLTSDETKPRRD